MSCMLQSPCRPAARAVSQLGMVSRTCPFTKRMRARPLGAVAVVHRKIGGRTRHGDVHLPVAFGQVVGSPSVDGVECWAMLEAEKSCEWRALRCPCGCTEILLQLPRSPCQEMLIVDAGAPQSVALRAQFVKRTDKSCGKRTNTGKRDRSQHRAELPTTSV